MSLSSSKLLVLIGLIELASAAVLPPEEGLNEVLIEENRPSIRMIPDNQEQVFQSGGTFTLICEAEFPLDWKLPSILETRDYEITIKNELEDRILIENQQLREDDDPSDGINMQHRSILTVNDITYTDTGYYACHHRENEEGDEEVKTYIYVADEDNLIVQHRQVMMFSQKLSRYSVIVPCKPSHPDIQMSLMIDKNVKVDWVHDPHVGFYIDNDFLASSASIHRPTYRCVARHPKGFEADIPVYIWTPFKPLISMESDVVIQMPARRIVVNQHFQLNCSITFYQRQNLTVELHWMVPQFRGIDGRRVRSDRVILAAPPRGGQKRTTVRLSLRVANATFEDAGFYMCASHQSSHNVNSMDWTEVFINIHHKEDEKFLMISTPYNDGPREIESGKTVTFVVYVDSRPDPIVNWYRDDKLDEPINTTSKYVVHRSWGKTYLKIRDTSVADNGVYRLVAMAGNQRKSLNFTLQVQEKRTNSLIMSWRYSFDYVSPLFWIHTQPAIIGFSYLQCRPPLPCLIFNKRAGDNDETVWDVDTSRQVNTKDRIVLEPLTIYVHSPENNTNEDVVDNNEERFFYLGWVVNTFYNSTGNGTWLWTQSDGTTILLDLASPPEGFNVSKRHCLERRGYCYRIKGINTNSDELGHSVKSGETFTWTWKSNADGIHLSVPIQIQEAKMPVMQKSNDSEVSISQGESVSLFCSADGMPSPVSQWLKDGQLVPDDWIKLSEDGTLLQIETADNVTHSGNYTCRFDNIAGTVEQNLFLRILDPSS